MRYGVLFEVAIRHDYWLNVGDIVHEALPEARQAAIAGAHPSARYIAAAPTAETLALLAGHGLIYRDLPNGFLVGVELEAATNVPRRILRPEAALRFALRLRDPAFAAYTAGLGHGFCHFSNASGNAPAGRPFLTRPVPPHQPARAYAAGEIRAEPIVGALDLFQALRDTGPAAAPVAADWRRIPADTHDPAASYQAGAIVLSGNILFEARVNSPGTDFSDAAQWAVLGPLANQYVTRDDTTALRPGVFSVDVTAAAANVLELRVTRVGAAAPAWQQHFEGDQPLARLQADLRTLPDGRYRLDVLDAGLSPLPSLGFDFFLGARAAAENWFGVIEIGAGAGDLALLDAGQALRSPRFEIRFLNQASRVRYRFQNAQPVGAGAGVAADPGDGRILVTPEPLPMTRAGTGVRLRADDPLTATVSEEILLPHPGAREVSKEAGQWFCDLHLANFPPLA